MVPRFTSCACALGLVLLAGCGTSRSSVEGTVSVDGTPVDKGVIVFVSEGDGTQQVGTDIVDGKYSISSERGPTPGKYKVQITWMKKTGKQAKDTGETGTLTDARVQVIPDKFNKNTELTADIKSGSNPVDFGLKVGKDLGKTSPSGPATSKASGD